MRRYKIYHTDSFTNELFGGNATVTVLEADSLSDMEMKNIAREMNLSETGFIQKSDTADFRLRFFTPPGNEIKFCGHATVGALCSMVQENYFDAAQSMNRLTIETNAGVLNVDIDLSDRLRPRYIFDAPKIELVPAPYTIDEVSSALGILKDLIDVTKSVMLEKTNNYLYFTARNLKCLEKIRPKTEQAVDFAQKDKIVVFCALTNETFDPLYQIHARGFAPLVGVPEDPFTGSMQGGLAAYAFNQNIIEPKKWVGVEQGHFMGRPGFVKLEVAAVAPIHVRLHCEAVSVFSSEIKLP